MEMHHYQISRDVLLLLTDLTLVVLLGLMFPQINTTFPINTLASASSPPWCLQLYWSDKQVGSDFSICLSLPSIICPFQRLCKLRKLGV